MEKSSDINPKPPLDEVALLEQHKSMVAEESITQFAEIVNQTHIQIETNDMVAEREILVNEERIQDEQAEEVMPEQYLQIQVQASNIERQLSQSLPSNQVEPSQPNMGFLPFMTLPLEIGKPAINMSIVSLPQYIDLQQQDSEPFNLAASQMHSRRKKKIRPTFVIDSKEQSVEQIRQQPQKMCIDLQPEPVPSGYAIRVDAQNSKQPDHVIAHSLEALPNEIVQKMAQKIDPDLRASTFSQLIKERSTNLPAVLQIPEKPVQQSNFDQLFAQNNPQPAITKEQKVLQLVQQFQQTRLQDGQVMQVPKDLGQIVTNKMIAIPVQPPMRQICQQFLMITMVDLITAADVKLNIRRLIRSNYKDQICKYILDRLKMVDEMYEYQNVEVLRMIGSRWIWDNVIPFMAECTYFHHNSLRTRLLPQQINNYTVTISKYHIFLTMSQMFLGVMYPQISTYNLPISFGEIMTIGQKDTVINVDNKKNKLKCLLHYFSSVMREKEQTIQKSSQFIAFQRSRLTINRQILLPSDENTRLKYSNLMLTNHLEARMVMHGMDHKQAVLFLTHENLCRESGEETFQFPYLMQETYRLLYIKPQIFVLKALTPRLDLGQAIFVHGLEQFSKAHWRAEENTRTNNHDIALVDDDHANWLFTCQGLFNQPLQLDEFGKRKGTVILFLSKLLFNQSYINNDIKRCQKISENFSINEIILQIQTLFSAFQISKEHMREDTQFIVSERYIKFIEDDTKWLYFLLVWIAASLARVKVIFEFSKSSQKFEAMFLMQRLKHYKVYELVQMLIGYRETMIEANELWLKQVEKNLGSHQWNMENPSQLPEHPQNHKPRIFKRTLLQYIKYFC